MLCINKFITTPDKISLNALEQYSNWWLVLQVMRYEHWLQQQDNAINQQLKYYEAEIAKIRKQRKVLVKFFSTEDHNLSLPALCLLLLSFLSYTYLFFTPSRQLFMFFI